MKSLILHPKSLISSCSATWLPEIFILPAYHAFSPIQNLKMVELL